MINQITHDLWRKFSGRLENSLIDGALNYIDHGESALAFEILCDHLLEHDVDLDPNEYEEIMQLVSHFGFDPGRPPFRAANKTLEFCRAGGIIAGMKRRNEIPIALWKRIESLIPQVKPSPKGGRPRLSDQQALNGIIYVLRTGIPWEELPGELGYGSGMTCWRRLRDWQVSGVWHRLHQVLLAELRRADTLDMSQASLDAASVASPRGARIQGQTQPIAANSAANGI